MGVGFVEGSANLLMAVVFMALELANISSLEEISSPYLKHNSVIKDGKNKHPFGLNAQVEIPSVLISLCLPSYSLKCNGARLISPCLLFQYV